MNLKLKTEVIAHRKMSGVPATSSSSSSAMGELWIGPIPSPPPTPAPPEASLTTQERLRLAKRRRAAQLKRWTQRDAKGPNAPGSNGAPDIIQGRRMHAMHGAFGQNFKGLQDCPLDHCRNREQTLPKEKKKRPG